MNRILEIFILLKINGLVFFFYTFPRHMNEGCAEKSISASHLESNIGVSLNIGQESHRHARVQDRHLKLRCICIT